jgi:predicted RNA-binding protein YlxR (DUF448 family)
VAKKTTRRIKHVPQRTCVGCRETLAKRSLIRVVRTPSGVQIDRTGKVSGRGAYLHDRKSCWERGLKGPLAHALKVELTDQDRAVLRAFAATLPDNGVDETLMQEPADLQPDEEGANQSQVPEAASQPEPTSTNH